MKKIKLRNSPKIKNDREIMAEFGAINAQIAETELRFLLLADLYNVPLFYVTQQEKPQLKNRDIADVYSELFKILYRKFPFKFFKIFLFERKFKHWLEIRGCVFHCNFFGLLSLLPNSKKVNIHIKKMPKGESIIYNGNNIPEEVYNETNLTDQLKVASGLGALAVSYQFSERILTFIDYFNPYNMSKPKQPSPRQPNIATPHHKNLCRWAGRFELELRCLSANKGNNLFFNNSGKIWSKNLEQVKQDLMRLNLPTVIPHRQVINNLQNLRNKLIHCNFVQLIQKMEDLNEKPYLGGVRQIDLSSWKTSQLDNTSSLVQQPNIATQNLNISLFGMLIQAYASGLDTDFKIACCNFITAAKTM